MRGQRIVGKGMTGRPVLHPGEQDVGEALNEIRGILAGPRLRRDQLGGPEAAEHVEKLRSRGLLYGELAGGDIRGGDSHHTLLLDNTDEVVVTALVQQVLRKGGPGGDHLDHVAPYDALGELRVFHLFADGHPLARPYQPAQVRLEGVVGHSGEGDAFGPAVIPGGERQSEEPGDELGILVEGLVKIPHAEQQNGVLVLLLELPVLLHQGGQILRHFSTRKDRDGSFTRSWPPDIRDARADRFRPRLDAPRPDRHRVPT